MPHDAGTGADAPTGTVAAAQRITSLTLVPCGGLDAFPLLAAPLKDGGDAPTFSDAFAASVVPAARLLHAPPDGDRAGVYALGDSRVDLPWGEAEARAVVQVAHTVGLPGEQVVQSRATRAAFGRFARQAQVLELASHGMFDRHHYLDSRLLLAAGAITLGAICAMRST